MVSFSPRVTCVIFSLSLSAVSCSRLNSSSFFAGDILIHCGDFSRRLTADKFVSTVTEFNAWLGTLPHRYKIVISGNHEIPFNDHPYEEIARMFTNATYLQDNAVTIEGLKIYGSPWTHSSRMAFSAPSEVLRTKWQNIPKDTNILVTHLPPLNVLDLAWEGEGREPAECKVCNETHPQFQHWGSSSLRVRV
jgi:Icc-related predicted phosphoesterase